MHHVYSAERRHRALMAMLRVLCSQEHVSSLLSLERLLFHTVVYAKCMIPERAANVQANPDRMQKDF